MEEFETHGKGYASEVLFEEIFTQYPVPHTISIIEGEVGPQGLYPLLSPDLEEVAEKIFKLDTVEAASHSFSHPFFWKKAVNAAGEDDSGDYHLSIPGYRFSLEREIQGSIDYINTLTPPDKNTKVFLWTGNCLPTEEVLLEIETQGLQAMNGGETTITREHPTISRVAPLVRPVGEAVQIYAPDQNENVFTNNWKGPFYGYRKAIETFQLTDHPRRLKPINIYYHFYSGSKHASLNSLKTVYNWAMQQETMPVYTSEYIKKAQNYRKVGIALTNDGTWRISGLNSIKSLRLQAEKYPPNCLESGNLIGWRRLHDGLYLHAGPKSTMQFKPGCSPAKADGIRLSQTNGRITQWDMADDSVDFHVQGHVPLLLEVQTAKKECSITWKHGQLQPTQTDNDIFSFNFPDTDTGSARLECTR